MTRRSTTLVVSALVLWGSATARARAEGYAIVVGVNDCPDFRLPDGSNPPPLLGAQAHAEAVARLLVQDYGFPAGNVRLLSGARATREALKAAFSRLAARVGGEDVFVFHF